MVNKKGKPTDILEATKAVADALNHLADLFAERRLPRTNAGRAVQFDIRQGYIPSSTMLYTLSQTERVTPADHAG